jgi:xylulokinase
MWYQHNEPELFRRIYIILGTKDYINYKLTGVMKTDFSYASGSGVYDQKKWEYRKDFIEASGIPASILPDIVPSTEVLGTIGSDAAKLIGLTASVKVVCGGVDNSCMALGAKNIEDGRVYTSLGSSSWIAVSSNEPVLDTELKPYVFAHVIPHMFTSAVSIFAAGTSLKWLRDNICYDLKQEAEKIGMDAYAYMDTFAEQSPIGSNKLLFNPSLAGGTSQDASANIRDAYMGLDLKHGKSDLIRRLHGGHRHESEAPTRCAAQILQAAGRYAHGGRRKQKPALSADFRRCLQYSYHKNQYRHGCRLTGRGGHRGSRLRVLERFRQDRRSTQAAANRGAGPGEQPEV